VNRWEKIPVIPHEPFEVFTMIKITLTILTSATLTAISQAAVTFDNISGATVSGAEPILGPMTFGGSESSVALAITTDAGNWELDSIEINFGLSFGGTAPIQIDFYTSGSPIVGGIPQTLNGTQFPNNTIETYSSSSTISLPPNSTFWLHIHEPIGDGEFEVFTEPSSFGSGSWTLTDQRINQGGGWTSTSQAPEIRINATSVPEPSSAALTALGLLAFSIRRRQKK